MKRLPEILKILFRLTVIPAVFSFPFLLNSCAPSRVGSAVYPNADYPLTNDTVYSASSDLTFRIPRGWTRAESGENKTLDLWLIRDDFSATLNLVALSADSIFRAQAVEDSLLFALNYSRQLKINRMGAGYKAAREDEFFNFNQKRFGAYEYEGTEGLPVRVVVFTYKGRYFELSAVPTQSIGQIKVDPKDLFRVQQSLIATIR
ncbi:MAG: hypothetical protein HF309_09005 [Ignavibacteria bacterium]|jgi:hypothetical protein|nr:hypothetical protein [Ignavibacteria bacterium]MCU7499386.1 hypothetical protein [Ignavibacteria bacterium]MCU7518913.1 hypothetical protein [Ignavibacteria bacterium]MCU7525135.1 hypothetical protein [Ignavibacteria bacterium]